MKEKTSKLDGVLNRDFEFLILGCPFGGEEWEIKKARSMVSSTEKLKQPKIGEFLDSYFMGVELDSRVEGIGGRVGSKEK